MFPVNLAGRWQVQPLEALLSIWTSRTKQAVAQPPPTPAELKDWASNTLFISVMGMAYCGSRQAWRNKQLGEQELLLSAKDVSHIGHAVCPIQH